MQERDYYGRDQRRERDQDERRYYQENENRFGRQSDDYEHRRGEQGGGFEGEFEPGQEYFGRGDFFNPSRSRSFEEQRQWSPASRGNEPHIRMPNRQQQYGYRNQPYRGQQDEGYYSQSQLWSQNQRGQDQTRGQSHQGKGPKGYRRSDDRILEDVCETLSDHPEIDASNIDVSVNNGEVTLKGTVEERQERRLAEQIVESVRGVSDVKNELKTQSQSQQRQGQHGQQQETESKKHSKAA